MGALAQEKEAIARPAQQSAPTREGPRVNGEIKAPQVRLIDENGDMVGVVSTREALEMAEEASLDLIEISPNAAGLQDLRLRQVQVRGAEEGARGP